MNLLEEKLFKKMEKVDKSLLFVYIINLFEEKWSCDVWLRAAYRTLSA